MFDPFCPGAEKMCLWEGTVKEGTAVGLEIVEDMFFPEVFVLNMVLFLEAKVAFENNIFSQRDRRGRDVGTADSG
jgi:hypothetical protein